MAQEYHPNWRLRIRVIHLSIIFCIGTMAYLLILGNGDSALHDTLATYMLILLFLIIGGYVFGQTVDLQLGGDKSSDESMTGIDTDLGRWEERRRYILLLLFLSAAGIAYLSVYGEDTQLHSTIASGLCLLYAGIMNVWIFGATWEDYIKQ